MQEYKINVSGLNLYYGENHALKNIDMIIGAYTVLALFGASG